jgi:hypothetical protein
VGSQGAGGPGPARSSGVQLPCVRAAWVQHQPHSCRWADRARKVVQRLQRLGMIKLSAGSSGGSRCISKGRVWGHNISLG